MSAVQNLHAMTNQGEFHARVPRSRPMTTKGHAPGVDVGNNAVPGFSAQILPAGSAPADRTHQQPPIPAQHQSYASMELRTAAGDSMSGATSADVNRGVGQPIWGQTSHELRSDGRKARNGLAGVGGDPRDPVKERALDSDFPKNGPGKGGLDRHAFVGAEGKMPQRAEAVAAERY